MDENSRKTDTRRCFICKQSTNENIISFDDELLSKFKKNMECRKFYRLKYGECELPSEVSDTIGYHSSCANRFKALKPHHRTIPTTRPSDE